MNSKQTCPIYQAKNGCRANDPSKPCWCTEFTFPERLEERLQQLPGYLNETLKKLPDQCICPMCAQKLGATKM